MLLSRTASSLLQFVPRRGMAAVKNWKRPTMEEYGTPKEAWSQVDRKNQSKYNMYLAFGIVFFAVTVTAAKTSGHFFANTTPWHLIHKKD